MLNRQNRVKIAVATAVAGGTLAAVTVGAFAATGHSALTKGCYGYGSGYYGPTTVGYGYGPCATAAPTATATSTPGKPALPTFIIGTSVIAAGQSTKVVIKGTPGDSVAVQVKGAAASAFTTLATVNINAAGVGALIISPGTNSQYRLVNTAGTTTAKGLRVKAVQTLVVTRANHVGTFTGHVAPSLARRRVTIYSYVKGGHVFAACSTLVVVGGNYKCTHTYPAGVTYYSFAETESDAYNYAGRSPLHQNVF